ncbi:hypothetical protein [Ramlibacter alkalitolerans]|uniref:Uncharacterized protein n=1 Tax=Ramlibacter alkalitolerans TaxID=2039631 RepID=A0ABS1JU23_9BURK|nr:hypothetical protein [Ramlibacter alkalitolerans]MBL0427671.1 hypothetical protein [Ramlibacter alkalitolerans]
MTSEFDRALGPRGNPSPDRPRMGLFRQSPPANQVELDAARAEAYSAFTRTKRISAPCMLVGFAGLVVFLMGLPQYADNAAYWGAVVLAMLVSLAGLAPLRAARDDLWLFTAPTASEVRKMLSLGAECPAVREYFNRVGAVREVQVGDILRAVEIEKAALFDGLAGRGSADVAA